jgi:hypothetical protein
VLTLKNLALAIEVGPSGSYLRAVCVLVLNNDTPHLALFVESFLSKVDVLILFVVCDHANDLFHGTNSIRVDLNLFALVMCGLGNCAKLLNQVA